MRGRGYERLAAQFGEDAKNRMHDFDFRPKKQDAISEDAGRLARVAAHFGLMVLAEQEAEVTWRRRA